MAAIIRYDFAQSRSAPRQLPRRSLSRRFSARCLLLRHFCAGLFAGGPRVRCRPRAASVFSVLLFAAFFALPALFPHSARALETVTAPATPVFDLSLPPDAAADRCLSYLAPPSYAPAMADAPVRDYKSGRDADGFSLVIGVHIPLDPGIRTRRAPPRPAFDIWQSGAGSHRPQAAGAAAYRRCRHGAAFDMMFR